MSTLEVKSLVSKRQSRIAKSVRFTEAMLYISLDDGHEIGVPLSRFPWLARATPAQRKKWRVEPRGFAVYWDELDDGIEIDHLLE